MTKYCDAINLEMEFKGIGMSEDTRWKEIVKKGHDQMKDELEFLPRLLFIL